MDDLFVESPPIKGVGQDAPKKKKKTRRPKDMKAPKEKSHPISVNVTINNAAAETKVKKTSVADDLLVKYRGY